MGHWKLTLSYCGTPFHGWQVQPGLDTVQGRLADAVRRMTGESVLPQGSGRTDAGVHALAQVASFTLAAEIPPANLQRALNQLLPPSVRIDRAELAPPDFHARHSARRKTYEYRVFPRQGEGKQGSGQLERICSPFLAPVVWDCRWPLCLGALQSASRAVLGTHDFSAMAASARLQPGVLASAGELRAQEVNPVKTIFQSEWSWNQELLIYRVCGSGFLHHMVRNLVGTMVDIGRGSLQPEDMARILASRDRTQAGPTAPASGLFLVEVDYAEPASSAEPASAASELGERPVMAGVIS